METQLQDYVPFIYKIIGVYTTKDYLSSIKHLAVLSRFHDIKFVSPLQYRFFILFKQTYYHFNSNGLLLAVVVVNFSIYY